MRILITSRGSSGHLTPIAPFAHAALRAGHEVLAAVQEAHQPNARRLGLPSTPVPAAPPEVWRPRMAAMMESSFDEANRAMLTEYFGRLDTEHALPALRRIVQEWRPDVIVRESWEFASTLVGEMLGVPVVRVGLAIGSVEEYGDGLVAPVLDELRAEHDLEPDPDGPRAAGDARTSRWCPTSSRAPRRPRRRRPAASGIPSATTGSRCRRAGGRGSTTRRSSTRRSGP